jgi:hypothetical protein
MKHLYDGLRPFVTRAYLDLSSLDDDHQTIAEWKSVFVSVHGPADKKATLDVARIAHAYGIPSSDVSLDRLLMSVETAYSIIMLAASLGAVSKRSVESDTLLRSFGEQFFKEFGIANYVEHQWYGWFRNWPELCAKPVLGPLMKFAEGLADKRTVGVGDALRSVYNALFPKQLRHALGSYYTPDWLAEFTTNVALDQFAVHNGRVASNILDPACGSGAFLLQGLRHAQSPDEKVWDVLPRICGFDISPLAVQAAKTNLLLHLQPKEYSLSELVRLPVYLADSLLGLLNESTANGLFASNSRIRLLDDVVEVSDEHGTDVARDLAKLPRVCTWMDKMRTRGLRELSESILFDASIPLQCSPFDVAIGNPPWVNWENLHPTVKHLIGPLWPSLGLYDAKGMDRAFSKEDLSSLFTVATCHRYLISGGELAFVVPQSLFKSALNSRGFRKFRVGPMRVPICVEAVHDFDATRPFTGVSARPVVCVIRKGQDTLFPVPYTVWKTRSGCSGIREDMSWNEVAGCVEGEEMRAHPADPSASTAHWAVVNVRDGDDILARTGVSPYRARTGVFTGGCNAVYYLEETGGMDGGLVPVRNLIERAKRRVDEVNVRLEPTYLYPLLRGREVSVWSASPSSLILCPHTKQTKMEPVPEQQFAGEVPRTFEYLCRFRAALDERKGFVGWERGFLKTGFYAIQRIGTYTFAPYKVVWRYICPEFRVAVVEPQLCGGSVKPVLPHEKLMVLGFETAEEAYYVGGILSSTIAKAFVESRMVSTQIAPHVIAKFGFPMFDPGIPIHRKIGALCREGHERRSTLPTEPVDDLLASIDSLTCDLLAIGKTV